MKKYENNKKLKEIADFLLSNMFYEFERFADNNIPNEYVTFTDGYNYIKIEFDYDIPLVSISRDGEDFYPLSNILYDLNLYVEGDGDYNGISRTIDNWGVVKQFFNGEMSV